MMQIDQKDAQILNLVQVDNRLTTGEIGDEIGLSHSGVVRRLKRLREYAVIVADVSLVSPEAVGYSVRVNVSCSIDRDRPDTHERFMDVLRADPLVISADIVMGKADFTFTVVARDMEAFADFLERYQAAFPTLNGLTSLAVLREVKRGLVILVEPIS
ncbi:Lrp/AsnC family transcriptional regulator [uncultured Enterovirga sp.]|uniref:Lrp/AsnC family transcriptional regulator n=1 Tax=uncultured Enterovirga sp. TaxID=2026352 RepID=UPI0035CBC139